MALSDGLIACWSPWLGSSGYRLLDRTVYANHGSLVNMDAGTDWVGATVQGRSGYALDFDGSNDRIDINGGFKQTLPMSFAMWLMRTADWHFAGNCLFWAKPDATFNGNGFYIEPGSGAAFSNNTLVIVNGSATNYLRLNQAGNTSFPLNAWTHFAFTITSSTSGQFYLNGNPASTTVTGTLAITATLDMKYMLNNSPGYGNYTPGKIADSAIWNRAITSSEVQQLYRLGPGWYRPYAKRGYGYALAGFKAYWHRRQSQVIGGGLR